MTCAYVAMSLLLSFYDSYWNDDFVQPITDANGNVHNLDWNMGSYNSIYNYVEKTFNANSEYTNWFSWYNDSSNIYSDRFDIYSLANQNSYLESYLISIGRNLQYHNNDTTIFFLWPSQIKSVLENYLYVNCGFNSNQVSVHMLSEMDVGDTQLNNVMKQKIADGYPVIYCGGRFMEEEYPVGSIITDSVGAHALIAYDVIGEGESEDILLHTGWTGGEYVSVKTTAYKHFNYIIWIEINEDALTHNHSNKYIDSEVPTKTYCACEIYSTHPNHNSNHIYVDGNEYYNDSYHWGACHCGVYDTPEEHSFSYINLSSNHEANCTECGYSYIEGHEYTIKRYKDMNNHELMCACYQGSGIIEGHYAYEYIYSTKFAHRIVCECGFAMGMATHTMVTDGPTQSHCAECGAVFNTGSDIIIKRKEEDQEMM